ncbi:MAG TPA: hypothetical protein VGZ22_19725 [Isosphaeraceae bacterium]|jgi:hypothetical protein|nr:hypothetical protein [Isosphaeraceae bacterium]
MACEKLGKAHAYKSGIVPKDIQSSHVYIAKQIPSIVRQVLLERTGSAPRQHAFVITHARHIAREIELLSPAVDDGGKRPDNCEYPWVDHGGSLHIPCEHDFSSSSLVIDRAGRTFLIIIQVAINRLTG